MAISAATVPGQILTSAYVNNNINSGLVLLTSGITVSSAGGTAATINNGTVTIGTNNTSVTVSGCFSSAYDNYRIMISGGLASGAADFAVQLSGITTSVYQTYGYFMNIGTATLNAFSPAATTQWSIGSINATQYAAAFDLISPNLTKPKFFLNSAGSSTTGFYSFSGNCTSTAAATGFVITPTATNLTGGNITVYGYRKV